MKYLVFDTETGGLEPTKHSLLSVTFFVVDAATEKILDTLELFIKPVSDEPYLVTAGALKVNKIDLVRHNEIAISGAEAFGEALSFLFKHSKAGRLIPLGHNVMFDVDFVRAGLGFTKPLWQKHVHYQVLDTATIGRFLLDARVLPPDIESGLGRLAKYFNVEVPEADRHTATGDVKMTLGVYKSLKALVKGGVNENSPVKKTG